LLLVGPPTKPGFLELILKYTFLVSNSSKTRAEGFVPSYDDAHDILLDRLGALQDPGDSLPSLVVDLQDHLGKGGRLGFLVLHGLVLGVPRLLAVLGFGVLAEDVGGFVLGVDGRDRFENLDL
jgi:hypothetical protein